MSCPCEAAEVVNDLPCGSAHGLRNELLTRQSHAVKNSFHAVGHEPVPGRHRKPG